MLEPQKARQICSQCHTEVEKRKIKFGQCYYIEILACLCDARTIENKYASTTHGRDEEQ